MIRQYKRYMFPRASRRDKNNILLYFRLIPRLSVYSEIALLRTPRALMLLHCRFLKDY